MPGDDLSCTGTLRLRDTPLDEPIDDGERIECSGRDGGMLDLAVDASLPIPDAAMDAEVDSGMDAATETDAGADGGVDGG